jgi:hypothetical protein
LANKSGNASFSQRQPIISLPAPETDYQSSVDTFPRREVRVHESSKVAACSDEQPSDLLAVSYVLLELSGL